MASPPQRVSLQGKYVTLEPLHRDHIQDLWALASHYADSWRFLPMGPFESFTKFRVYSSFIMNSLDETVWCVRPHDAAGMPGKAAGWLALLNIRRAHGAAELGNVWFPPPFAGTPAATEAKMLLLEYAFETLSFFRVEWKCHPLHHKSRAAAERLGFQYEGISRGNLVVKAARRDSAYYSMLAEEWPARRAALRSWLVQENFDAKGHQIQSLARAV